MGSSGGGGGGGGDPSARMPAGVPMPGIPVAGQGSGIGDPYDYGYFQSFLPQVPESGPMSTATGLTSDMFQYRSPSGRLAPTAAELDAQRNELANTMGGKGGPMGMRGMGNLWSNQSGGAGGNWNRSAGTMGYTPGGENDPFGGLDTPSVGAYRAPLGTQGTSSAPFLPTSVDMGTFSGAASPLPEPTAPPTGVQTTGVEGYDVPVSSGPSSLTPVTPNYSFAGAQPQTPQIDYTKLFGQPGAMIGAPGQGNPWVGHEYQGPRIGW